MKKLFILPAFLLCLFSCNHHATSDPHEKPTETPKTLLKGTSDLSGSWSSRSYESSIITRMYNEMLGKDKALKALDDNINAVWDAKNKLNVVMQKYDNNNHDYYNEALADAGSNNQNDLVNGIRDTLLKATIIKIVKASSEKYEKEMASLRKDFEKLEAKNVSLRDYYTALKIVTTLPGLEAYQQNEKPSQQAVNDLTSKFDDTIGVIAKQIK